MSSLPVAPSARQVPEAPEMSFVQAVNFRVMLRRRLAQLEESGLVAPVTPGDAEALTNLLLVRVMRPGYLVRHGLHAPEPLIAAYSSGPIAVGDASWWAAVSGACRRVLPMLGSEERRAIHMAVGSSLRMALLEGRTYHGLLRDRVLSKEGSGWTKGEAVAFARRFFASTWRPVYCKAVTTEVGDMTTGRWRAVQSALSTGELRFDDFVRLRELRNAYDSYVLAGERLRLPWPTPKDRKTEASAEQQARDVMFAPMGGGKSMRLPTMLGRSAA